MGLWEAKVKRGGLLLTGKYMDESFDCMWSDEKKRSFISSVKMLFSKSALLGNNFASTLKRFASAVAAATVHASSTLPPLIPNLLICFRFKA